MDIDAACSLGHLFLDLSFVLQHLLLFPPYPQFVSFPCRIFCPLLKLELEWESIQITETTLSKTIFALRMLHFTKFCQKVYT